MANTNPPKKNQAYTRRVQLLDAGLPGTFRNNPTIASGDCKLFQDGGGAANPATTPSVSPSSTNNVLVTLTAAEMNYDEVVIQFIDQTNPKQWNDLVIVVPTTP